MLIRDWADMHHLIHNSNRNCLWVLWICIGNKCFLRTVVHVVKLSKHIWNVAPVWGTASGLWHGALHAEQPVQADPCNNKRRRNPSNCILFQKERQPQQGWGFRPMGWYEVLDICTWCTHDWPPLRHVLDCIGWNFQDGNLSTTTSCARSARAWVPGRDSWFNSATVEVHSLGMNLYHGEQTPKSPNRICGRTPGFLAFDTHAILEHVVVAAPNLNWANVCRLEHLIYVQTIILREVLFMCVSSLLDIGFKLEELKIVFSSCPNS